MRTELKVALVAAVALSGCVRKYTNAKEYAEESFDDQFGCTKVEAKQQSVGWLVTGCGDTAVCDVYGGEWRCDKTEPSYLRAWRAVLVLKSDCAREQVIPVREAPMGEGYSMVQVSACGTSFACDVRSPGSVSCQRADVAGPPAAPPPPPPPPSSSGTCTPKCRSGYVCTGGRCVSACNPPCAANEKCGADGECHR